MRLFIAYFWKHPKRGLWAVLLALAFALPFANRVSITGSLSGFEAHGSPLFEEAAQFDSLFGRADALLLVAVEPSGQGDFWKGCAELEKRIRKASPGVEIYSPRRFARTYFSLNTASEPPSLDSQLSLLKTHPKMGAFIGQNGQSVLLVAQTQSQAFPVHLMDELRGDVHPSLDTCYVYSIPELEEAIQASLLRDMFLVCGLLLLVVLLYLGWAYRSWKGPLWAIAGMVPSLLFSFLLYGILDIPINVITSLALPVVLVLALCDAIHLLGAIQHEGPTQEALERLATPSFFSSLTSAAAFFSFAFSETANIQMLGLVTGLALLAEFFLSLLLAPLWMPKVMLPSQPPKTLLRVTSHLGRYQKAWTWGFAAMSLGALALLPRLHFQSDPEAFYPNGHVVTTAHRYINSQFQAQNSLSLWGDFPSLNDGQIQRLEQFCDELAQDPRVLRMDRPNQELNWDQGIPFSLPEARKPNPLGPFQSPDGRLFKADFRFRSPEELVAFSQDSANAAAMAQMGLHPHSGALLYDYINHDLARSLFKSLSSSGLAIVFVLWLLTRSWKQALLGLVPNILPLGAAVWAFTLFGLDLNLMTAITAVVCLGLLDDDTVHVLYRRMVLKEPLGGLQHSLLDSALLLSLGFGLFTLSHFYPTRVFGAVSAGVFLIGILGELTFFQRVLDRFSSGVTPPHDP